MVVANNIYIHYLEKTRTEKSNEEWKRKQVLVLDGNVFLEQSAAVSWEYS